MNKLKELIIQALDEGEATSVKDMKWPALKIGKWLFISTGFLSPLLGCFIGTLMDVNSKEFIMLSIPLLLNVEICLCWLLYHFWGMLKISRKKMMVYTICMVIIVAVASLAVNRVYKKSEVNLDLNLELEYWNRFSTFSDQELLKIFLVYTMDNDTVKASQTLGMPKNTLIRLLDGTSTATRYASSHIRNTVIQSHCYGKEYILGSNQIVLNDSISRCLYQLWERPNYDNDLTE